MPTMHTVSTHGSVICYRALNSWVISGCLLTSDLLSLTIFSVFLFNFYLGLIKSSQKSGKNGTKNSLICIPQCEHF